MKRCDIYLGGAVVLLLTGIMAQGAGFYVGAALGAAVALAIVGTIEAVQTLTPQPRHVPLPAHYERTPLVGNGHPDCEWCEGDESLCDGRECEK